MTALSRDETLTLVYDKLRRIEDAAQECSDSLDRKREGGGISGMKTRIAKIAVEARRALKLIDEYESVEHTGTCLHCGKSFEEHEAAMVPKLPEGAPHFYAKDDKDRPPRCGYVRGLFVSAELETYR